MTPFFTVNNVAMANPPVNLYINAPELNLRTLALPNPGGPILGTINVPGPNTPLVFTHKIITDVTNDVAANRLRNGTNIATLGQTAPSVGQLLAAVNNTQLAWSNGSPPTIVYVDSANGSDGGTGALSAPFETIQHAIQSITAATPTRRYCVCLAPGVYPGDFALKANVFVVGYASACCVLAGNISIDDLSWHDPLGAQDNRAGFTNVTLSGTLTVDHTVRQSGAGCMWFQGVRADNTITVVGFAAGNQNNFTACQLTSYTMSGCVDSWQDVTADGSIQLTVGTNNGTSLRAYGGGIQGGVVASVAPGSLYFTQVSFVGFVVQGSVSADGSPCTIMATVDSLSLVPTLTNGAVCQLQTPATALRYLPARPVDWAPIAPTTVSEALDRLAAKVGPVP